MQDSITRIHSTPAPTAQRRQQQRRSTRAFTLLEADPDDDSSDPSDGQRNVILQPRPSRTDESRVGTRPLAEEAGQSLDVRA